MPEDPQTEITPSCTHPGGHELQLRHDGRVDQVPVHHQADLHGVGGEGQQVGERTDCKAMGHQRPARAAAGELLGPSHAHLASLAAPSSPLSPLRLFFLRGRVSPSSRRASLSHRAPACGGVRCPGFSCALPPLRPPT